MSGELVQITHQQTDEVGGHVQVTGLYFKPLVVRGVVCATLDFCLELALKVVVHRLFVLSETWMSHWA